MGRFLALLVFISSLLAAIPAVAATPSPRISYVSPNVGPVGGGGLVNIVGTGLSTRARVTFGTRSATVLTSLSSSTKLVVKTPAAYRLRGGYVSVKVANSSRSVSTLRNGYQYLKVIPAFAVIIGADRTTTQGSSLALTATINGGILPLGSAWDFGDGTSIANAVGVSKIYSTPGDYAVQFHATDALGRTSQDSLLVHVLPIVTPTSTATPTTTTTSTPTSMPTPVPTLVVTPTPTPLRTPTPTPVSTVSPTPTPATPTPTPLNPPAVASCSGVSEPASSVNTHHEGVPNPVFGSTQRVAVACKNASDPCLWSNPATWTTGIVPGLSTKVIVDGNVSISDQGASALAVGVYPGGSLSFAPSVSTRLSTGDLIVFECGSLTIGSQTAPIQANVSAEVVIRGLPFTADDPKE